MLYCMSDRCSDLAIAETQHVKRVMNDDGDAKDLMLKGGQQKQELTVGGEVAMVHAYCMPWQAGFEEWMVYKSTEDDRVVQEATGTLTAQEDRNFGSLLVKKWESKSKKTKVMSMTMWVNYFPRILSQVS